MNTLSEPLRSLLAHIFWRRWAVSLLADVALVLVFLWWTKPDGEPINLELAVLLFLAIQAAQIVFAVKNGIAMAASTRLLEKRFFGPAFLRILRDDNLPPPSAVFRPKRFDYLEAIANDADLKPETRVRAMATYAAFNAIRQSRGFGASLVIDQEWDAAIAQYDSEMENVDADQWQVDYSSFSRAPR